MKKKMVILVLLLLAPFMIFTVEEKESAAMEFEVIPDDAIRLRILANSDEETDQEIKYFVRDQVSAQIDDWVGHMTNIEEAREYIRQNIPELDRKSTRLNSSHVSISYAVFCLKKKKKKKNTVISR